jgi:hypothetical protein
VHLIAVVLGLLVLGSNKLFLSFFHIDVDLVGFFVLVHAQNGLIVVDSDFLEYFHDGLLDVDVIHHVLLFGFLFGALFFWGFNLFHVQWSFDFFSGLSFVLMIHIYIIFDVLRLVILLLVESWLFFELFDSGLLIVGQDLHFLVLVSHEVLH